MSSSASRPPEFSESTTGSKSPGAASRPALVGPPKRPTKPVKPPTASPPPTAAPPPSAIAATPPPVEPVEPPSEPEPLRQQPISPPSEPMQYRAIGLLRGRYTPTEEVFNRGQIVSQDGTSIDAVLLGRVTSLVKKYLDMETDHLWVVYPRTNPEDSNALNVQIVGVWEPETLMEKEGDEKEGDEKEGARDPDTTTPETASETAEVADKTSDAAVGPAADATDAATEAPTAEADCSTADSGPAATDSAKTVLDYVPSAEIEADVFSIRGEVSRYHEEKGEILIGIQQKVKSGNRQQRTFKLLINGTIHGKTIGYFWDFDVRREGRLLVVHGGNCIGAVPPKKNKKRAGGGKKRFPGKGGPPRKSHGRREFRDDARSEPGSPKLKPVIANSAPAPAPPAITPEAAVPESPPQTNAPE
ncbi:MAG: hypothetical protein AAFR15_03845 [Cyanobacteria bacterium J06627_15]